MNLQSQIEHFLKNAYSPDNLDSARDKLDKAIGLLRELHGDHVKATAWIEYLEKWTGDSMLGPLRRMHEVEYHTQCLSESLNQ